MRRRTPVRSAVVCSALVTGSLLPVAGLLIPPAAAQTSDKVLAGKIDLTRSDLPGSVKWTSSANIPNTPSQTAEAEQAIACVDHGAGGAKLSGDPFGLTGKVGGTVTADVASPMFAESNQQQLPGLSSEVTILTTAAAATNDQRALSSKAALPCLATLFQKVTAAAAKSSVTATATFVPAPPLGTGNRGVDVRIALKVTGLSATFYQEEYLYVQGRSEVALTFANLASPFPANWIGPILTRVMARAKALVH